MQARPYDDFFDLGGNSLAVVDVVLAARRRGITLRSSAVFRNPTPARLAEALTIGTAEGSGPTIPSALGAGSFEAADRFAGSHLAPIADADLAQPLVLIHSDRLVQAERHAAGTWTRRPIADFVLPGFNRTALPLWSVPELAGHYAENLLRSQFTGPYHLVGIGSGGVVAFELARLLSARDSDIAFVGVIRPAIPADTGDLSVEDALRVNLEKTTRRLGLAGDENAEEILRRMRIDGWYTAETAAAEIRTLQQAAAVGAAAVSRYRPEPYNGRVVIVHDESEAESAQKIWEPVLGNAVVHWVDYGVESLRPVLGDPKIARIMQVETGI